VSTATMPRLRMLPLLVLGRPRKATGETRVPVVALAFTTSTTVVVVVAMAAVDVSRRRVVAVARRPFSINDPVVPRVYTGSSSTSVSAWWVLHQVKVHQHPEGESPAAASRLRTVELCLPTRQGQPGYLWNVGWVVRPSPETECPGVCTVQRRLLDVVNVASSRSRREGGCPPGTGERST